MTNKIVAIQGNHPSKLNPKTDTSVFLANEIQKKKYRVFYYDPKDLSIIDAKVIAKGFFIKFSYKDKKFYKIQKKQNLNLIKCKYILIRQDPPFNLEYISTTYILETIKHKVKIINNPTSIRNISEKLYSVKYQKFMPNTIFTQNIEEIIIATNPKLEGEATAMYIQNLVGPLKIKITRLARGLPSGSDIEYADDSTLEHALNSRSEI